jgi:hypothetical protein
MTKGEAIRKVEQMASQVERFDASEIEALKRVAREAKASKP